MQSANHNIPHPGRVIALGLAALVLLLLSGYALGGCAGALGVVPSSQGQNKTPTPGATDPTPPLLPTPQPTSPLPPRPEPTGPRIPTPAPTLEPTLPPPPPSPTPLPTSPPLPTLTVGPTILLTRPLPDPKQAGVEWFASTGHTLRGAFLEYWSKNGGLEQFGYPLTEEFVEITGPDNKQEIATQYFEHAIFTRDAEEQNSETQSVKVQLVISGREELQQTGYANGRYPLYGYATDYSWLSGQLGMLKFCAGCLNADRCAFLSYDRGKTAAQMEGITWWRYASWKQLEVGQYIVVFGHLARADEQVQDECRWSYPNETETRLYIVQQAQMNSAP